jgi:hypothetical protein
VKTLTIERLTHLAASREAPVVTLIGPVRKPHERSRAELEWRHLVAAARGALGDAGVASDEIDTIISPIERELAEAWPAHERAIAGVLSVDEHQLFALTHDVEPFWAIGDRAAFHALAPVVDDPAALVLTLDLHGTRLYQLAGGELQPMLLASLPRTLADVVPPVEHGQHLTHHGGAHVGRGIVGIMHGEDDAGIERQHELDAFCRAVDDALSPVAASGDGRALVVAGVTDLVARLRSVAARPERYVATIDGSPGRVGLDELAGRARASLVERRDAAVTAAVERFRARHGLGLASDDIADIAAAAQDGRVDELLLPAALTPPSAAIGAIDGAIANVLADGGRVVVVPPTRLDTVAATYRW